MRIATCAVLIASLAACKAHKSKLDKIDSTPSHASGEPGAPKGDEPPKLPPLTSAKLAPVINLLGAKGVVPTSVVVELATPIADPSMVGGVSAKTKLVITPEVAGTLSYSGPSELTFTPTRPLEFDTDYKIELQAVETRDGVVTSADGPSWTKRFKTPAFTLMNWAPVAVDLDHHK